MKKKVLSLVVLCLLFTACSFSPDKTTGKQSNNSNTPTITNDPNNPWIGNWYGYVGDLFYKLRFENNYAYMYYTTENNGWGLLYKSEQYVYSTKSFSVVFKKSTDGSALKKEMEIYGTMISGRDDGFYLWNSSERPFFKLDE